MPQRPPRSRTPRPSRRALSWGGAALCATALLLLAPPVATAQGGGAGLGAWPFGVDDKAGRGASFGRLDLFNLGLIGAKAWDAAKPLPQRERSGGRRRIESAPNDGSDRGPERLKIVCVFPRGPGDRAGLRAGDVVVGVGQRSFEKGCFGPLADALLAAEAATSKGTVLLRVERQTPKGPEKLALKVKIPGGGKVAKKPFVGKGRDRIVKAALDWLADRQTGPGGFPQTLGGTEGAVVQTSVAGLAWIAGGSNLAKGRYSKNLQEAAKFVLRGLEAEDPFAGRRPGGANWDQSTWAYAYTAVFLGELHAAKKSPKLRRDLQRLVDVLVQRQEASGGYAHGPGGKNALGYLELNIMAGFVLSGLGLAQKAGCEVDEKMVARYAAYLEQSSSGDGGVGYADSPGQKGMGNIGRTAGAWLGLRALGRGRDPFVAKMGRWTRSHVADVMDGHASLMQHITWAGVAAGALGSDAQKAYWKVMLRDLTLARAPDGSLQPRPWHESLSMGSNSDVSLGGVWTTASWALVLAAPPEGQSGGLRGLCGK